MIVKTINQRIVVNPIEFFDELTIENKIQYKIQEIVQRTLWRKKGIQETSAGQV